jgi:prepilin-type N-terminal cleavage/methylation domain-containing protein/prepilin-type processing-associated H-X9-DG protein
MKAESQKAGFTLVELLVVIAIIGTLMGLLLPAVQSAREAGRRNTCMNNLSQLAKAMVAYDGKRGALPSWKNKFPNTAVSGTYTSWVIPLLPDIERADVYRSIESLTNPPLTLSVPIIELLNCPSSPPNDTVNATSAYSINIGSAQTLDPITTSNQQARSDGAFVDAIRVTTASGSYAALRSSLDSISSGDGTATTLMMSEKAGTSLPNQAYWGTLSAGSPNFDWTSASNYPAFGIPGSTFAHTATPTSKALNGTNAAIGAYGMPSSAHPGGVMAVFCDGHVQFMVDSMPTWTYTQLVTSDSRYNAGASPAYYLNSPRVNAWLGTFTGAAPYVLQEADFK